jgi:signal peptidase II
MVARVSRVSRIIGFGVAALALSADQASKHLVVAALKVEGGHLALPGPVDLTLVFNLSNAFGVVPVHGEITRWGLIAASVLAGAVLLAAICRLAVSPIVAAASGFLAAGVLGNGLDRVIYGRVVDFVDAGKIGFHWVFNVSDACIDIGLALFAWSLLRRHSTGDASPG